MGYASPRLRFIPRNKGLPSDILLCRIVRISQTIHEISQHLSLSRLGAFIDANNYDIYAIMDLLKDKVDTRGAQVQNSLASLQTLKVWYHVAMIYIYEIALHTPTNKNLFVAPLIPGRISVKDFPKPITCIPPLITALNTMIRQCHALLDIAVEMDSALVLGLPAFSCVPNMFYALFILVPVFVATIDSTNTYSQYVSADRFLIEEYGMKLQGLSMKLKAADPTMSYYTTRFIDATGWLEQWYTEFKAIVQRYKANTGA